MADERVKTDMRQITELFTRYAVEFIVIGGQAETLLGGSRVTYDVDLCYRRTRDNMVRLASAMKELNPKLRGAPADLPFQIDARTFELRMNFTFKTTAGDLDLLGLVEPLGGYDDLLTRVERYPAYGTHLLALNLDDLLKVRLHINRPKDQESIAQLKALKRIRQEQNHP